MQIYYKPFVNCEFSLLNPPCQLIEEVGLQIEQPLQDIQLIWKSRSSEDTMLLQWKKYGFGQIPLHRR